MCPLARETHGELPTSCLYVCLCLSLARLSFALPLCEPVRHREGQLLTERLDCCRVCIGEAGQPWRGFAKHNLKKVKSRGTETIRTSQSVLWRVAVREADGTVFTDDTTVVTRWAGYFDQLFQANPVARTFDISGSTVLEVDHPVSCEPLNLTEIAQVVNQLRFGKEEGIYAIQSELLQAGGKAVVLALQAIFASIWETGIIPSDWKAGLVVPIWKWKGDHLDCGNYRRITLLSVLPRIISEISKKVAQIQNAGLGEFKIRDLNDEINKLLREKGHWEVRIKELGGPDYARFGPKMLDQDGKEVPGNKGYKYFGAAKDLQGVRELFEKEPVPPPRKTRAELMKDIDAEYYGYRDEDDGVLVPLEQDCEKLAIAKAVQKWKADKELRLVGDGGPEKDAEEDEHIYRVQEDESDEEEGEKIEREDNSQTFMAHVPVPSQKEIEEALLRRKKMELLQKYASESLMAQNTIFAVIEQRYTNVTMLQPSFGLLFDIDGVLVRGKTPLPAAKKAFQKLVDTRGQFLVPVVFVTNAGNCLRQTKADQLSEILGVKPPSPVNPPKVEVVVLFGEPIRWETNLQLIVDTLLTNGNLGSALCNPTYPHIPLLACNMDLMWMAEAQSPRFGHGTFMVCLENIYKKITGKELRYEALMGKPSELTYHYAEYLIRAQSAERKWRKPIRTLYAIGDNVMTDVYGANLYNRYLDEKSSKKSAKALAKVAAVTGSSATAVSQEEELDNMWENELSPPSAVACKSVLVCTGVYNPYTEIPTDGNECITETVFHGHRDFGFEPALVEPDHIVEDVDAAVQLIFKQENYAPQ
ncbi:ISY1 factor, partial [Polypterus senegalus]